MKKVIYITLLCIIVCAMAGCRTAKVDTIERYRYDSLANVMTTTQAYYNNSLRERQVIIDSLRMAKLPTEKSVNKLPLSQRSVLNTSLAHSEAWIDSMGLLNHNIANNDSALLPVRMVSNVSQIETKDVVNTQQSRQSKVAEKSDKSTSKIVVVTDHRFMSDFLYKSGVVAWIAGIIYILYFLQFKTKLQPFSRLLKLIKNLIK